MCSLRNVLVLVLEDLPSTKTRAGTIFIAKAGPLGTELPAVVLPIADGLTSKYHP